MHGALNTFPTVGSQVLRTLARYPDRIAFAWPGGTLTYRATTDMIARFQNVFMALNARPGTRVSLLTANRADSWCASVAAQLCRFAISSLHPMGSLQDQIDQIEDAGSEILIIDADTFLARGGELATKAQDLKHVFTLGRADYGIDLLAAADAGGSATAKDFAQVDDDAVLNYTGGTTGKIQGCVAPASAGRRLRQRGVVELRNP